MAVEPARCDELRERQLVQRAHDLDGALGGRDVRHQVLGQHHPGQPEGRGERLARRAKYTTRSGSRPCSAPTGAVVAELTVVVVLQDQPAVARAQSTAAARRSGRQRDPGRELVGGRQQHRADAAHRVKLPVRAPRSSTKQRRDAQAGVGEQVAVEVETVRLDGDGPHPPRPEPRAISASPWWKPEQMTIRSGSAYTPRDPRQVVRERGAQLDRPSGSP